MRNAWTNVLIGFVSVFAFAACDIDTAQSVVLSGNWQGDFGMFYTYRVGGRTYRFDSYDTELVFYPKYDYATYGYGKEIDYYEYGPYEYQVYYFNWEIVDGIVYLDYPSDHNLSTAISDYQMTNCSFSGYFGDSDSRFNLTKVYDYYEWTPCVNVNTSYYYCDRYDWYNTWYYSYWTKSDNGSAPEAIDLSDGAIVERGNRFNEAN
ncbi:MAG: hypothetical protein MJZ16_10220 [Bacteroidales bacterium]|nr:hypothetical protein [Bacteroidales bacterium]